MSQPIKVGITHGDINGISYEIIIKALADEQITELFTPIVFGSSRLLTYFKRQTGIENFHFNQIGSPSEAHAGVINLVEISDKDFKVESGTVSPAAGEAALISLKAATDALKNGEIDVIVTAPINKDAIQSDDFHFPGHTEFLQENLRCEGSDKALMILFNDMMRVALVTTHLPISQVSEHITKESVLEKIHLFNSSLKRDFGIDGPKIAVLALNPHAGDGGLLGKEEQDEIKPAINQAFEEGIFAFGPYPADGFFGSCKELDFDGILAMYHDQGLIPLKASSSEKGVNFTAGLPFVRTSPDHGTAFDIAGRNIASPESMRQAIYAAIDIFRKRNIYDRSTSNPLKKQYVERGADKTVDLTETDTND